MPFKKFTIHPQHLSCKALPPDKAITDELEAVSNVTLVEALRQLSCLLTISKTIFSELSEECQACSNKTQSLKLRLDICQEKAQELNAKKVQIPVGNLSEFSRQQDHFQFLPEPPVTLFTAETRPFCVQQLCDKTAYATVPFLNFLNHYYAKERRLMCLPVISEKNSLLEIEKWKPAHIELAREWKKNERVTLMKLSEGSDDDQYRLPSPEEKLHALSLDFPSSVVSVDVTGNNFRRMTTIRRSLIHVDFLIKRKKKRKRRNTICEGSSKQLEKIFPNMPSSSKSSQTETCLMNNDAKTSNRLSGSHTRSKRLSLCSHESLYKTVDVTAPKEKNESPKSSKLSSRKSKGKSFIPISTLSAAMSVAVKLRGSSARSTKKSGEEAQSSSGNWSASSSTRGSVDSAQHIENSTSQSSLGKDSLFSDNTPQDNRSRDSPLAGYVSDISAATPSPTKHGRNQWRHPPDREDRSRTLTPDNTCSDSASTPRVLSPHTSRRGHPDESPSFDDEESVYSVDTDGYFTSMHTDSGLKNPSPRKLCERRGSHSSVSTIGNVSLNSLLSRTAGDSHSNSSTLTRVKRSPPVPPPRITSTRSIKAECSPTESDPEVVERLKAKTKIDSSRYPSMCSVSPEGSDEERQFVLGGLDISCNAAAKEENRSGERPEAIASTERTPSLSFIPIKPQQESENSYIQQHAKVPMIPLKYAQHITVTPVSRDSKKQTSELPIPPGNFKNNPLAIKSTSTVILGTTVIKARVSPVISSNSKSPMTNSMDSLSSTGRAVAKVTLDPNGKVIFSSNSLGRRRDGHPLNYVYPQSPTKLQERKYATLPSRLSNCMSAQKDNQLTRKSPTKNILSPTAKLQQNPSPLLSAAQQSTSNSLNRPKTLQYNPSAFQLNGNRLITTPANKPTTFQLLFPKVLLQSSSKTQSPPAQKCNNHRVLPPAVQAQNFKNHSFSPGSRDAHVNSNSHHSDISNNNQTAMHPEPQKLLSPHSFYLRNSSDSLNSFSSIDSELTSPHKPMSNEDLFAAIHNSRKRLGGGGSLSPDSGSTCSISPYRPWTPQPRNELAEKGSLNLRYSSLRLPRERHSWAEGGKVQERRTLASDRHGPTKQTSMRDFKLLLLQARSASTPSPCSKKTAAEMLRATAPPARNLQSPASLPPSPCTSPDLHIHSRAGNWNGVCTVPFKRGSRGRSSLQSRYDFAYPPIIEDCREDGEVFSESANKELPSDVKIPRKLATSTWV